MMDRIHAQNSMMICKSTRRERFKWVVEVFRESEETEAVRSRRNGETQHCPGRMQTCQVNK